VRVNDPALMARLLEILPPGWMPDDRPEVDHLYCLRAPVGESRPGLRRFHVLYADGGPVWKSPSLDEALEQLEGLLHWDVSTGATERIFVHAGVAAWHGRAVVLPGRSMVGKSTLVEALVRQGAVYYSDEYAVIDGAGRVHPYARRLRLRGGGEREARCVSIGELGGTAGTEPIPVGLIAAAVYHPGARWRPRVLTPAEGMMRLLDNTVLARERPEQALPSLAAAADGALCLGGRRGEADEAAEQLLRRLEAGR
jgi:hypothetical protein